MTSRSSSCTATRITSASTSRYSAPESFGGGDRGRQIENFTRVEVHGFPEAHWVRITVDPGHAAVFSFKEQIVDANRFRKE